MMRAEVDLEAAGGVDPSRLERSLTLRAQPVGRGRYRVWGGAEPHWVDLYTRRIPRCDCGDHLWRDRVCKHILAAMLREGDDGILAAVGRLVTRLRSERQESAAGAGERGARRSPAAPSTRTARAA